ncbi:MAG: hypothetical protein IPM53_03640 [Anaerolineaceae bacterium]|nr:hypothetical protein [Anaerolineaceae bacterium]
MNRIFMFMLPIVFLMLLLSLTNRRLSSTAFEQNVFEDDFEADKAWSMYEEIVGGSSCYGDGIGEVSRTTDVAFDGMYSLRVWSNKVLSGKSNHVIGQNKLRTSANLGFGIMRFMPTLHLKLRILARQGLSLVCKTPGRRT